MRAVKPLILLLVVAISVQAHADYVPTLSAVTFSGQTTMPLGDSITFGVSDDAGDNSYRYQLYTDIVGASLTVSFVGSQTGGSLLPANEQANEGHPGYLISDLRGGIDAWIAAKPGMTRVILMIGINDVLQKSSSLPTFQATYGALLDRIHTDCPACVIYDMDMLPVSTSGYNYTTVLTLNPEIKSACLRRQSFCRFVEVYSACTYPTDFSLDGIHPLNACYNKIGNVLNGAMSSYGSASVQGY